PTDRRSLRPAGKQPNPEFVRQADNAILAGAYPLAAVVDKRPVAEMTGQRPAADPALRLQYQDIYASGRQQPRRVQARQATANDDDIAGSLRGHTIPRTAAEGRGCCRPDPSGRPCAHPTTDPRAAPRTPRRRCKA